MSRKSCPSYIGSYYVKWVKTSWTYSTTDEPVLPTFHIFYSPLFPILLCIMGQEFLDRQWDPCKYIDTVCPGSSDPPEKIF